MNTNFQGDVSCGLYRPCLSANFSHIHAVNQRGPIIYQAPGQIQINIYELILISLCQVEAGIVLVMSEALSDLQ